MGEANTPATTSRTQHRELTERMESGDMSDTESVKGDTSEEELEELDMEEDKEVIADGQDIPTIINDSTDIRKVKVKK